MNNVSMELIGGIFEYYRKLDIISFKNSLTCVYNNDSLLVGIMVEDSSIINGIVDSLY